MAEIQMSPDTNIQAQRDTEIQAIPDKRIHRDLDTEIHAQHQDTEIQGYIFNKRKQRKRSKSFM